MDKRRDFKEINIDHTLLCPRTAREDIHLRTSSNKEYVIKKGERIFLPKHIEVIKALESKKYKHILFGGALGGAKSHLLRGLPVRRLMRWAGMGYRNVQVALCSESFPTLRRRHINVMKQWPDWLGRYYVAENKYVLREEWGGGVIQLLNLDDATKYASDEYAEIYIEELTFNSRETYDALSQRKRWIDKESGDAIEDGAMISASNPGRLGGPWVYEMFVDPKTRYKHPDCYFVQALLQDNPFLPKSYAEDLEKTLPPRVAQALLKGDWTVFEGQYFTNLEESVHYIRPFPIPAHWSRFRAIDHGYNHPTVCLWGAVDEEGTLYIYKEHSVTHRTAEWHKERIAARSKGEKFKFTVVDPALKRVDGSAEGNKTPFEVYNDPNDGLGSFRCVVADRSRVEGWHALLSAFDYSFDDKIEDDGKPNYKKAPKIFIFQNCPNTWSSLRGLIYDEKKVDDVAKSKGTYQPGQGDDEAEALRYLYYYCLKSDEVDVNVEIERASPVGRSEMFTDNPYASGGTVYSSGF